MQVSLFDSFGRNLCVACISGYQKHLSPRKGFACAHRILYGEESCSQYIKRVIAREGIKAAIKKSRKRFQACKQASQILRARSLNSPFNLMSANLPEERRQKGERKCSNCNQQADGLTEACDCIDIGCGLYDCASMDCGSMDCSGADCSFLDCGFGS